MRMLNTATLTYQKTKIGKEPVVVVSVEQWKKIEEALEDLAMYLSKKLQHNIRKARSEVRKGRVLTFEEVQKKLGLV